MAIKKAGTKYLDQIDYLVERNKLLVFFFIAQLVIIILLVNGLISAQNNVEYRIELPPKIYDNRGELRVGHGEANRLFYRVWGEFIARSIANYNPSTVRHNFQGVIYMMDPEESTKYQSLLAERIRYAEENMEVRQANFYDFSVDGGEDSAVLTAKAMVLSDVGNGLEKKEQKCVYKIGMKVRDYRLVVDRLSEECKDVSGIEKEAIINALKAYSNRVQEEGEYPDSATAAKPKR